MVFQFITFTAGSYLLGSIPFGKLIAKRVARVDITQLGSGNLGATNVAREIGLRWGLLTLLLDMLKGLIPVVVFTYYASGSCPDFNIFLSAIGLSALFGHQFSIFQGFRGGKGVSTTLGIFLGISPLSCLFMLVLFVLVVYRWRYISLGSIISACAMPLFLALFSETLPVIITSVIMATLICYRHKQNIHRLINAQERKWGDKDDQARSSSSLSNSSSE